MTYKIRDDYEEYLEYLQEEYLYNSGKRHVKSETGRELELLLREIEKMTRPYYFKKASKNKKNEIANGFFWNNVFKYSKQQLCIIKASYRNDNKKHKAFIKSYMPQHDKKEVKEKPTLFNETKDIVSEEELRAYQEIMDDKFFRIILSPDRQDVSLKLVVREFIKRIEALTGYELFWHGVIHYNTLKMHAHIEINGRDKKGQDVYFDRVFFKVLFREIAQDICTKILGERTAAEIRQDLDKRIRVERWTRFDYEIKEKMRNNNDQDFPYSIEAQNSDMQQRLLFLEKYGYAKKIGTPGYPGKFLLNKDWELRLRNSLIYNSYNSERDKIRYNKGVDLQLYKSSGNDKFQLTGKIVKIIEEDMEVTSPNAFILQDEKNQYWYVPFHKFVSKDYLNHHCTVNGHSLNRIPEHPKEPAAVQKTPSTQITSQTSKPQNPTSGIITKTPKKTAQKKKNKNDQWDIDR